LIQSETAPGPVGRNVATLRVSLKTCFLRSAWISRKLRLLRAHAVITQITGTHRYQLTSTGRKMIVAILSALCSTVAQLTPVAAQPTGVAA
jgi:hypothetical protein